MQSAVDSERFALGRAAGRREVERTVCDAKNAGIENISLDLMLGTPKQSLASLDKSLDFIDKMNVQHVSAYMLKIEEGTKFFEMKSSLPLPDEDEVSEMYLKTIKVLSELGFDQYEISNFARRGFESRHNTKYWELAPYLGIGKSAHSFWQGRRFYYDENMNVIDDGAGGDVNEQIMLGLRLTKGIDKSLVKRPYAHLIKMGLLTEKNGNLALTPDGMLVSNAVINELI
jgi:oxygen-independent coproporphyrinogen-3 oxidase